MFRGKGEEEFLSNSGADDTVIGHSIKIEGDLVSAGSIVVEGEVTGSVKTDQTLRIGEKAKVTAEVRAKEAFVSGKVNGNIIVEGKLELNESAEVNGDIHAKTVSIAAGAVFNGKCSMTEQAAVPHPSSAEAT